jgi:hypothetical protein
MWTPLPNVPHSAQHAPHHQLASREADRSIHMAKNAVAFFAGLGSGYLQQKDRDEEKQRRDKRDAREQEQHDATMAAHRKGQAADAAVAGASRPMVAGAGGMSKPDTMDNRDVGLPENAALPNGGLAESATANTPQAIRGRQVAALQGIDPERADRLQLSGKQAELTDLQLKDKKDTITREDAFREATKLLATGGWSAVPQVYDRYQDGHTAQVQEDGKGGATITRLDKDGKPVGSKTFGDLQEFILGQVAHIDPKLWVSETRLAAQNKEASAHRTATLEEQKRHNKATERDAAARTGIASAADKRAAAAGEQKPAFDPLAGFDNKKAQSVAMEQASKEAQEALAAGKPLTAQQQAQRAQQIYQNTADAFATEAAARERSRVFKEVSRSAKTPEEIEAVRQRAKASGYTDAEMAALNPRFAVAKPAAAPAAPARATATSGAPPAPVDRIGDQPIGPLTRMADIQEAAQAGNPRAIAWLQQRAAGQMENATAPRSAAAMLGVQ